MQNKIYSLRIPPEQQQEFNTCQSIEQEESDEN